MKKLKQNKNKCFGKWKMLHFMSTHMSRVKNVFQIDSTLLARADDS